MTSLPDGFSRAQAVAELAAALSRPVTGAILTQMAREVARVAPSLPPQAVAPPPGLRERLLAQAPAPSSPPRNAAVARAGAHMMVMILDACATGAEAAVENCLAELAGEPDAAMLLTAMTPFLDTTGLARDLSPAALEQIAAQRLAPERPAFANAALGFLGLSKTAALPARRRAFFHAAVPYMRRAAQAVRIDALLSAESTIYEAYLKSIETPEHHTETYTVIEAAYSLLPATPRPAAVPRPPGHKPRIAFLIQHGGMLAHTEVLASFLTGLGRLEAPPIEPIVLMHAASNGGELGQKLEQLGVRWEAIGPSTGPAGRFARLGERIAELEVDAAVVVSLPLHVPYLCRRPVAPRLIWWSMKFPLPNFETLDGRVFYRSLLDRQVEVGGRIWRGSPLAFAAPSRPDAAAVAAIRARFPGMKILGTIAREEKVANAEYLAAIVGILQRRPDTCFLWTGRNQLAAVRSVFDDAGVADRCHFIGWVDPTPYIAAFDLFLETYPLTGLMCGWAMALGKPVISVGPMGFLGAYLQPVLDGTMTAPPDAVKRIQDIFAPIAGRLPGIWADSPAQIGAFADALLADPELAATLGAAQKRYVETFMADEAASAAAQARHFAEIVSETAPTA